MSGIEIAGLVLGGFRLLIATATKYKKSFERLQKWYKFRTEFLTFIDAVDIQRQLFNLSLECFLRSIDIEEDELEKFMDDGGYEGWHNPELFQRLKIRLGSSLEAFQSMMKTMNGLMHDLERMLLIKDGQVEWLKEGSSRMDYQMFRLRHSFSKKGVRAVESLKSHNETLRYLLDGSEKLSGLKARSKKDTTWANVFEAIRRHASSVHAALRAGWSCQCAPYTASLRLEQRNTGDWDSIFNLAFEVSQDPHTVVRCQITVKARKPHGIHPEVMSEMPNKTQAGLNTLRRHFQSEPSPKVMSQRQLAISAVPVVPQAVEQIKDLCSVIRNPSVNKSCLGYLCDGERLHDVLLTSTALETESYVSLCDTKEAICNLSVQRRIKLAIILASSLLQLQTTPWLMGSFDKRNIFFYRRGQEICLDQPYVRHCFDAPSPQGTTSNSHSTAQSETELRYATRTSLDNLGILLLELCFGQAIETTPIRKRYLVDGKSHQGTDYMTARDWVEMVWEKEPKLESIIKCCLFQPFEEKSDWRNKLFTQAIYTSIVGSLDDYFVAKWP
ncbi:hypothetical protein BKA64DRAFT_599928 [Cadophora sp. MPI-SDFR-AT-0126]|nr:hypothetical protein BKA64DRAFT_599928 [Leotiomycetes sp. MPI-SDFR-AT-0126]